MRKNVSNIKLCQRQVYCCNPLKLLLLSIMRLNSVFVSTLAINTIRSSVATPITAGGVARRRSLKAVRTGVDMDVAQNVCVDDERHGLSGMVATKRPSADGGLRQMDTSCPSCKHVVWNVRSLSVCSWHAAWELINCYSQTLQSDNKTRPISCGLGVSYTRCTSCRQRAFKTI